MNLGTIQETNLISVNIFSPVKCYFFKMSDESENSESNSPGELSDAELNTSHK